MARNDVFLNINALSPADAVVTGQQDMTAATVPELVLGDTPTFNFLFTDNTNVWPSWAGNASYTLTWALSDAVAGDFAPAATTGNATPITGGWSVVLPLNSYDLVGLLNTKRVGQPYPVTNLWQQLRVTDPSGNEITRAMFWTPVRYRAISDTQNTESASPTGGRFVTVNNVDALTTPTAAQFYGANPVPISALGSAANGELLIGNGTGFTKSTLTAGTGITVTNGSGSITIDATGAQETLTATVKNAESVAITKGQVVYLFGATGNMPSVKLAYNTSDATSAKTFGVVSDTSIAPNGTGTVTCVGVVDGLNLGAYQDGDTLYLGATPGSITATKPYAPNHLVYVGIVERANAGNGELYVRVQNGYELDEIHDVQINAPRQSGQTLIYDNTTSLWKNARITAGSNIAVTNGDGSISIGFSGTLPVANGGTGVTTSTGSGSVVLSTSPTLTTPNIGAATGTSFNLTGSGTLGTTLTVNGTTDSSSKDTGAIVTEGGLGVEKSASIGGNLTVSGTGTSTVSGGLNILSNSSATGSVDIGADARGSNLRLSLNAAAGNDREIITYTAGLQRWKIGVTGTAESGSNAGSNWILQAFADNGSTSLGNAISITRSTLATTLAGNLTVSGGTITGGTSGMSLAAGGTNQNITLTPSGTGSVAFSRLVAASATAPSALAAGSGAIYFQANGSVAGTQDSWVFDTGYTDQTYRFKVAGTDRVIIAANTGNLLIGTTTDGGQKLQVSGTASITGAVSIGSTLNFDTGNAAGTRTIVLGSTYNSGTWLILNGSTEIGSISAAGGFKSNVGFRAAVGSGPTTADYGWASSSGFYSPSANVVSLTANNSRVASWSTTAMTLDYTTASTSTTTGALVVSGGVGVAGAVNVGGAISIGNTVNTVSPTSPNRTITMVIGGTTYYIHAKTTND